MWPLVLLLLFSAVEATAAAGGSPGRAPRVVIDEIGTPLQQSVEKAVKDKKDREKQENPACDETDQNKKKSCRFPGLKTRKLTAAECPDCGELKGPDGRVVGKKIATETILDYENPGQRGKPDQPRWERILLQRGATSSLGQGNDEDLGHTARARRAVLLSGQAVNDDGDCLDRLTGEHKDAGACFDNGTLKPTLEVIDGGCRHVESGIELAGSPGDGTPDDCYDAAGDLKTTLEELFDEDGPEAGGDRIDQDGDGVFDEDAPADDFAAACRAFGRDGTHPDGLGDLNPDGTCDLTRAVIARANARMKGKGKKLFKADDHGAPTPDGEGVEYGQEPRRVKLTETFAVRCRGNATLVDGQCVAPAHRSAEGRARRAAAEAAGGPVSAEVLMGFTFAPPVIEWGYGIQEEVCIDLLVDEFCFEIFAARVGYSFDVAAGLRLPIQVGVSGVPEAALASRNVTLEALVEPLDFTVGDYKNFCDRHNLDQEPFIASCDRFAFPDLLDEMNPFSSGDEEDGAELVAKEEIFAGVQVRILEIPVIDWALDSNVDLPGICTMYKIKESGIDLNGLGDDLFDTRALLATIKDQGLNCASFTTPFGFEDDPSSLSGKKLRSFPFTQGSYDIPADCAQALAEGKTIKIKGKERPICTGLVLGVNGASLGVGLRFEIAAGSNLIKAGWNVSGDAEPKSGELDFTQPLDSDPAPAKLTFKADNYQEGTDSANVELDDFTYYLNAMQLKVSASLQFGGILSKLPEIASFQLLDLIFSTGTYGIPIGQHAGTEPVSIPVFVENYALRVEAGPATTDPLRVDDQTLRIKPGTCGDYRVGVHNLGSVEGDFDNFLRSLSNRPDQSAPFTFVINPNTDFDCTDAAGSRFHGNPYDGVADGCYTAGGGLLPGRLEAIDEDGGDPAGTPPSATNNDGDKWTDEDPPDVWTATDLSGQKIETVARRTSSVQQLTLSACPFLHPLTRPGLYPVKIEADSLEARTLGLPATDPLGNARLGAGKVVFIEVIPFYEPRVTLEPDRATAKPGLPRLYVAEMTNRANVEDGMKLAVERKDSNQAGCTLTTLGSGPGCPFRATPTRMPIDWTTLASFPAEVGPFAPLGKSQTELGVRVPRDWAGMQDMIYEVVIHSESINDPEEPPARRQAVLKQTVIATKESMTRYIGLEIDQLIAEITAANQQGIKTGGLLPISLHPARMHNDRALQRILAGDLAAASQSHATTIHILQAFQQGLSAAAKTLPPALATDWKARAEAILRDLAKAQASQIAPAAGAAP